MKSLKNLRLLTITLSLAAGLYGPLPGAVSVPQLFSDGAVLQRDMPVAIWGKADPGETVTVSFAGQKAEAKADAEGKWHVWLEPMPATDPSMLIIKGTNQLTINDVCVGEVWLCAGQSNMEGYAYYTAEKEDPELLKNLDYPNFRYFRVGKEVPPKLLDDVGGDWVKIIDSNVRAINNLSAIGVMLGRDLSNDLKVPVGIIQVAWGGSKVEAWIPREVLESRPDFKELLDSWAEREATMPDTFEEMKAMQKAKDPNLKVTKPMEVPTRIYNGMLGPVIPYTIRGIVWYQGESNAYQPEPYREMFPAMITAWRERWGRADLPFIFVQLPGYQKPTAEPQFKSFWATLRESQEAALDLNDTYMVVSIDIGAEGIHPNNKTRLEPRIYKTVNAVGYGAKTPFRNPRFASADFQGGKAVVTLQDLDETIKTADGGPVQGFALAGSDNKFHWADATIDGDHIVVTSKAVPNPVAVRYAFGEQVPNNLVTASGLPVAPFRSDDW